MTKLMVAENESSQELLLAIKSFLDANPKALNGKLIKVEKLADKKIQPYIRISSKKVIRDMNKIYIFLFNIQPPEPNPEIPRQDNDTEFIKRDPRSNQNRNFRSNSGWNPESELLRGAKFGKDGRLEQEEEIELPRTPKPRSE